MCTKQLVKLQGRLDELRTEGAAALAISIDPPAAARQVVEGHKLAFPILSDPHMQVIRRYGLKGPGMEMADLGYVVIDREGRILARRIDREFGDHVDQLLQYVRQAKA